MSEDKYLRVKQVVERTGLSRPTIYNMMNAGTFPNKTALGVRAVAWLESEIIHWMKARKAVEKTGKEAKPGRPPTASTKKKVLPVKPVKKPERIDDLPKQGVLHSAHPKNLSESEDWGQNDPPPSDVEMDAIRFRRHVNQPKKPTGTPLKGRTRQVEILPTSVTNKKIVVVSSHDVLAPRDTEKKK
jgi:prophage regulatory protein